MAGEKYCNGCKKWKNVLAFAVRRREKDGLHRRCRDCNNKYYHDHTPREKMRERNRYGAVAKWGMRGAMCGSAETMTEHPIEDKIVRGTVGEIVIGRKNRYKKSLTRGTPEHHEKMSALAKARHAAMTSEQKKAIQDKRMATIAAKKAADPSWGVAVRGGR